MTKLSTVYQNYSAIADLKKQIKALEEENAAIIEKCIIEKVESDGEYRVVKKPGKQNRFPQKNLIIAVLGRKKAWDLASFSVTALDKELGKEQATELCSIEEGDGKWIVEPIGTEA